METATEKPAENPNKFLILSEDGDCLIDMDVFRLQREEVSTRRAMVETYYLATKFKERSIINVTPVRVLHDKTVIEVMADIKTGTLYHKTGECLSSDKRRVIKWEK